MRKILKKRIVLKHLRERTNPRWWIVAIWILATLWILSSEINFEFVDHNSASKERLSQLQNTIYSFQFSKRALPNNLLELRIFANAHDLYFTRTDSLQQNISYFPFAKNYFFLKSYGNDGEENRLNTESDLLRSNLPKINESRLSANKAAENSPTRFPFSVLEGADLKSAESDAPDLHARLFVNAISGKRYLVVRKRGDDSFLMISAHDRVEEFLWLPDRKSILFTASGSANYLDGVYIWNLESNELRNVAIDIFKDNHLELKNRTLKVEATLAGMSENSIFVFARKIPKVGLGVEDGTLYQTKNLYLAKTQAPQSFESSDSHKGIKLSGVFDSIPETQLVVTTGEQKGILKDLFQTPIDGAADEVVERWQDLVGHFGNDTSLTPHLMWTIACLYMHAYDVMKRNNPSDAKIAGAYAIEILKGLIDLSYAPGYLKTEAGLAIHRLDENKPNPFHYGKFK